MGNDGDTIFCHRDVELQHVYTLIERVLKCRESVLRPACTRAPMTVHQNPAFISGRELST